MSDIDYHRVNLGVDYADEIIDYDEEVPYNINSNNEIVSEEVVNVTELFNETIQLLIFMMYICISY